MGEIRNFIGAYPLHSLAFGLVAAWELTKITQGVQSNMLGTGIQPNRPPLHPSLAEKEAIAIDRHLRPPTQPKVEIDRHLVSPHGTFQSKFNVSTYNPEGWQHNKPKERRQPRPKPSPRPSTPPTTTHLSRDQRIAYRTRSSNNRSNRTRRPGLGGLGMTTSTSMSTSSSHIPGLMASSAGETSMPIESNALYGVPNTVRRRVLYGDMPNTPADNIAKENALITANSAKQRKEHSDIVSMQGVFAPVGGYGWI